MVSSENPRSFADFFPIRHPGDEFGIVEILYQGLLKKKSRPILSFKGRSQTVSDIALRVGAIQAWLHVRGLKRGSRVALMLDNHPLHIAMVYALTLSGITWVPINTKLRSAGVQYILGHCCPEMVIVQDAYKDIVAASCAEAGLADTVVSLEEVPSSKQDSPMPRKTKVNPDDVLSIIYTSGTTGPPKGVLFTHRMMRIASEAVIMVADVKAGDSLFLWEPLCHIGGTQVLMVPFLEPVELQLVERFSASSFWRQIQTTPSTHLHYLGGILDILMRQPENAVPAKHSIRLAWGAGVSAGAWQGIRERFGFELREVYGMTECSSFTTVNTLGVPGSIGRPLPWLDLELLDDHDHPVPPGEIGQIVLSTKLPGVFFPHYLNAPEATGQTLRNGKLYTGDMARSDREGNLYFVGRLTDSIRVRGENVSAWEVERVFMSHPAVEAVAAIGVKSDIGEQDIKLFIQFRPGMRVEFAELSDWAADKLAGFQVPRYYLEVDGFEYTPSLRIRKHLLPRDCTDCWVRN
ncbi:MAG: AMP-binding protein [Desulfarculaceae bacterium]|jgi:crotonobetaine/carnitine-CoA ligase